MNRRLPFTPPTRRPLRGQAGISLVELMIAITLGLVIVAALSVLFVDTSRTNREMARANAMIENGRFAMQLLENEVVHAGYWGSFVPEFDDLIADGVPTDAPSAVPDPCLAYSVANWTDAYKHNLIGIPLQPEYSTPSVLSTTATAACTAKITDRFANTDVLIVRHVDTCVPGATNCEADTSGKLYFQTSRCEWENTGATQLPKPPKPPVAHMLETDATFGFTLKNRDCTSATVGTIAVKRKFVSDIYYVRNYARVSGDGIPTLVRSRFDLSGGTLAHQDAEALIEGIEGFRVEYGIDSLSKTGAAVNYASAIVWGGADPAKVKDTPTNRGDGIPDGDYVRCTTAAACTAAQLTNVTAVKLYVLARGRESTPNHQDTKTYTLGTAPTVCSTLGSCTLKTLDPTFKRHVFSTTVRLSNISGRRETP